MEYKEYLNSAWKHYYTCEVLSKELNPEIRVSHISKSTSNRERKFIVLNLYYLSGYIIECIVKYAIFNLINYKKGDIKKLDQDGLTYDIIKHHRFERYVEHLNKRLSIEVPLINTKKGIEKEVRTLFREWDAEVRYSSIKKYDEMYYQKFYHYSKQIFEIIRNNTKCWRKKW